MRELVSKDLIERMGEYNSSNPLYKGTQIKKKEETGKPKKDEAAIKAKKDAAKAKKEAAQDEPEEEEDKE